MKQKVAASVIVLVSTTLFAQPPSDRPSEQRSNAVPAKRIPYFVDPSLLDLALILPLPPTQDSQTTKAELPYVHHVEQTRTPEKIAAAQADDREEDLFIFTHVIGSKFTKGALPLTAALSAHVHNDEAVSSEPLKGIYKRQRPYNYDSSLHPVCKIDKEPSYPSGHSMTFIYPQVGR
jgi:acid phosphatase (class A)